MLTDFHSHILPNLDDGSSSLDESLKMLQMEAEQGVGCVVATPHFYARRHKPEEFLRLRQESYLRLLEKCSAYSDLPQIVLGAEVHYFSGISESEALSALTIAEKKCILIEMPYAQWTDSMFCELEHIYVNHGITPIIAHIDRYLPAMQRNQLKRLDQLPVVVQANAEFFTNRATSTLALRLLRDDKIQIIGSDCHNLTDRAPNLGAAVQLIHKNKLSACIDRMNAYVGCIL